MGLAWAAWAHLAGIEVGLDGDFGLAWRHRKQGEDCAEEQSLQHRRQWLLAEELRWPLLLCLYAPEMPWGGRPASLGLSSSDDRVVPSSTLAWLPPPCHPLLLPPWVQGAGCLTAGGGVVWQALRGVGPQAPSAGKPSQRLTLTSEPTILVPLQDMAEVCLGRGLAGRLKRCCAF